MGCLRCSRGFDSKVRPHDIPYRKGSGMFPLCEDCWKSSSIEERKRYVSKLLFIWFRDGASLQELIKIEKKVYKMIERGA